MRTAAVSDNVMFIALTTHILQSYRSSLTMHDKALFAPHTPSSPYTPAHHAAAAALLRTYNVRDALDEDFDVLAKDILPEDYQGRLRGAARGSGASYVPLSGEEAMAVQVYSAYRRARKEMVDCVEGIVGSVVGGWRGTGEERELLRGRLAARGAVDLQRGVVQGDMDAVVVKCAGVERLGYDDRGDRVVFLKRGEAGGWVEV
ncbi:uncharacterized protein H6S33_007995 [Morchella sextelata]|uniref:uncharacterized protein n=1 Tax=Morchella sextelata TaxID=1174677 RepID=UPI001D044B9D|nr:uncharacterized protein H6S33_007995 [Morchella sextelata]KAH0602991.1 hypothetical protein H6S33_007995 [Morchella sextelata]